MKKYLLLFLFISRFLFAENNEKSFVIIIPSYNNINYYQKNLTSVINQKYSNFRIIYIDDLSKDGTGKAVDEFIINNAHDYQIVNFDNTKKQNCEKNILFNKLVNSEKHFITVVHNKVRCGAFENLYRAIYSCDDDKIIVSVDGDDWLYHDQVLKELNEIYSSKDIWLTHGTLIEYPWGNVTWCEKIPENIIASNTFRKFKCPSHTRTFYSWLFKKIKLEDLLWKGEFFPMAWDMAMMFPMIEMAHERHQFIEKVNYVYNMETSLNDNKVNPDLQNELDRFIRNKKPYKRLDQ